MLSAAADTATKLGSNFLLGSNFPHAERLPSVSGWRLSDDWCSKSENRFFCRHVEENLKRFERMKPSIII